MVFIFPIDRIVSRNIFFITLERMQKVRILILYYSLSGQSRGLVKSFSEGLKTFPVHVHIEQIKPQKPLIFPFKGIMPTLKMMLQTFLRVRIPIQPLSNQCFETYDHVILAGPTWSYNPSGPILSLIDEYGSNVLAKAVVTPIISCRGYYRLHDYLLRKQLLKHSSRVEPSLIYKHPISEPWSTLGVFLKSAGYHPERNGWLKKYYPRFGHSAEQFATLTEAGATYGANCISRKLTDSSPG